MSSRSDHEEAACQLEYSNTRIALVVATFTTIRNLALFACIPSLVVVCMEEHAPARRVFDAGIYGSRPRGRPCIHWKAQIEEVLSSIGVSNWCRRAKSRDPWKDVLLPAEIS